MQRLTQTKPNCWQLCVAIVLDIPAEILPDQTSVAGRERQKYADALRVYLRKHHQLTYVEVNPDFLIGKDVCHLMIGETVRTAEIDAWHAVVGIGGNMVWDVSPHRDGLTKVLKFGLIIPVPKEWEVEFEKKEKAGDESMLCKCPTCESEKEATRASAA